MKELSNKNILGAKKRFGQNFLCDEAIIQKIAHIIYGQKKDHLIEIGPGHGILTKELLGKTERFDLIELDRDLIPELEQLCQQQKNSHVYQADILRFDLKNILLHDKACVFGNLPYNISTPLLFHLLQYKDLISNMFFMLQKEVAERLAAKPKTSAYGRLSVMIQYNFDVEVLLHVPPQAFRPVPKVDSAFVKLTPRTNYKNKIQNPKLFADLVREAFNHRRKTLRNSLHGVIEKQQIESVFAELNLNLNARAEELSVEDFVNLSNSQLIKS